MDHRYQALLDWLESTLPASPEAVEPVAGDASFRRYFRVHANGATHIAMDAPPAKEGCEAFVALARHWHDNGVHVPELVATDVSQGFLLLEDLGDALYLDHLTSEAQADSLYGDALEALARIQMQSEPPQYPLPDYDRTLLANEMQLFPDWLLERKLGLELSSQEKAMLQTTFSTLIESALAQPRVTVHRDYHSRNLLVTSARNPGIIDFQDAVIGPVTYDVVSLLKDCYIGWSETAVARWLEQFRVATAEAGLHHADSATFTQWFELMGIQRHLKAAGIFARLDVRDGKPGYLADIPRVLDYIVAAASHQPALMHFAGWLRERVIPAMMQQLEPSA